MTLDWFPIWFAIPLYFVNTWFVNARLDHRAPLLAATVATYWCAATGTGKRQNHRVVSHWNPRGDSRTRNLTIGEPPSSEGGSHETSTIPVPTRALAKIGAPGPVMARVVAIFNENGFSDVDPEEGVATPLSPTKTQTADLHTTRPLQRTGCDHPMAVVACVRWRSSSSAF